MNRVSRYLLGGAVLALVGAAAALAVLQQAGAAPRVMARYIERRADGHRPALTQLAAFAAGAMQKWDRGEGVAIDTQGLLVGAQSTIARNVATADAGREFIIDSVEQLAQALEKAGPGDSLTMLPGRYRLTHAYSLNRSGREDAAIVLRARVPRTVFVEVDSVQGFVVSGSDWRVENLDVRGVCEEHGNCEHAFHIVGGARRFTALNNVITDFNAHFKINGESGRFPDDGRLEGNTLANDSVRRVDGTVALIDMVGANNWVVRRNLIRDFAKNGGDRVSYGAYAKGGGAHNMFEQNIVLCESKLPSVPGARIGLSLGGGGTGAAFCRDGRCITEQDDGTIRANLVASCSDVGIYLNSAARSTIDHNTVLDTAGIDVRYATSAATIDGNLVDGLIRSRNGGTVRLGANVTTATAQLYVGWHPVRSLFASTRNGTLAWSGEPPRDGADGRTGSIDLCGMPRPEREALGAFEDFSACRRQGAN